MKNKNSGIATEFIFLSDLVSYRIMKSFEDNNSTDDKTYEIPPAYEWSPYLFNFLKENDLAEDKEGDTEDVKEKRRKLKIILFGLAPYLYPDLFDKAIEVGLEGTDHDKCPLIGGVTGRNCPFFLPTGETAIFLIAGEEAKRRLEVQDLFGAEYIFWEKKILWLEHLQDIEPPMHGRIIMSQDYVDQLTMGNISHHSLV